MTETLTFRTMTHSLSLEMQFNEFDLDDEMPIRFEDDGRVQYFYLSQSEAEELLKHLSKSLKKLKDKAER